MKLYLDITENTMPGAKQRSWRVSKLSDGFYLGEICYNDKWRQYVFEPANDTIWTSECLQHLTITLWANNNRLKAEKKKKAKQ